MKTTERIAMLTMLIGLAIALCVCEGCSGWTYNGVRGSDLRRASGGDLAVMAAGVGATYGAHAFGHVLAAEIMDKPWHYEGLSEIVDGRMSNSQAAWFGRAGFVAQLAAGYGMRLAGGEGYFVKGYQAGTLFEIATYPAMNAWANKGGGDDFDMIERDGNAGLEWAVYTAAALGMGFGVEY